MKLPEKIWIILLGLICLGYIALRLWNLTASCLWFDEIFSIHAAEHTWNSLWWFVAQDLIHPPLFYVLLKIWISIGGESVFWLRFFSVFFSTAAIIPFISLCRELKLSFSTIALALAFFALNGSLIKYAQEVRMYSLLLCFGLISIWLFARFLNSGKRFTLLIVINILLVYTHYFGWMLMSAEVIAIAVLAREKINKILLMFALTGLSFSPWLYAIWRATRKNANFNQNLGWADKPNLWSILQFVFDFFEPVYFQRSNTEPASNVFITVPIFLLSFTAFVLWLLYWKERGCEDKFISYLLLILGVTPILLTFFISWILPYSIWGTRHLLIVFAPLTVLLAIALEKIKFPHLKTAILSIILSLSCAALLLQSDREKPKFIWCGWENLAGYLQFAEKGSNEPVKIYAFEDMAAYDFWFALRHSDIKCQIIKVNGISDFAEDKAYFLPRGFEDVQMAGAESITGEQFWILFRAENWDETKPPLQNLLMKGYKFGAPKVFQAQGWKAFLVEAQKAKSGE